ncbi:MAG: thioredoxin family protein [Helicobacter sp.]|nr:thioredoxin family protein [Helicobacter sp.]
MEKINTDKFKQVISGSELVVVDFSAPWCPDCVRIDPILKTLQGEYAQKAKFYQVNIDDEESLKNSCSIRRIPTILFYKNGVEVADRLVEPKSKKEIEDVLKNAIVA